MDWTEYVRVLDMNTGEMSIHEFNELTLEQKMNKLTLWIRNANDVCFGKVMTRRMKNNKVKWWTDELVQLKKEVRKRRRIYQKARKHGEVRAESIYERYIECARLYKRRIMQ